MAKNTNTREHNAQPLILMTGAGGTIGRRLTDALLEKGYRLHHLVRESSVRDPRVTSFLWNVPAGEIDPACIAGVTAVIHLAGEPVADRAWSPKVKQEIVDSRTKSIELIYNLLKAAGHALTTVVSASAVGYYGDRDDDLLVESDSAGSGFLPDCCLAWEAAVDAAPAGVRVVKFRTGIVLEKDSGALAPIAKTVALGIGSPLGSGKQWMPWIHIDDVVAMYIHGLESDIAGAFNMAAPNPVPNREFTATLAKVLKKPFWMPRVPALALRILMGKRSRVALDSVRTSADKILASGFQFSYLHAEDALNAIYPDER